jgi:mono/diheme cytochrome c family protein
MAQFRNTHMKISLASALPALALALATGGAALAQAPAATQRTAFPDLTTGEAIYKEICQGCHMPDAKGASGAGMYPALAANRKLAAAAFPVGVMINGLRAMPEFGSSMNDAQIAGVVTYVRSHFGNAYADPVTAADVAARRAGGQTTRVERAPG